MVLVYGSGRARTKDRGRRVYCNHWICMHTPVHPLWSFGASISVDEEGACSSNVSFLQSNNHCSGPIVSEAMCNLSQARYCSRTTVLSVLRLLHADFSCPASIGLFLYILRKSLALSARRIVANCSTRSSPRLARKVGRRNFPRDRESYVGRANLRNVTVRRTLFLC